MKILDSKAICFAFQGHEKDLAEELSFHGLSFFQKDHIFFLKTSSELHFIFSALTLRDVQSFEFQSISEASKKLKSYKKIWIQRSLESHRRAELIQEAIPSLKTKPVVYLEAPLKKPEQIGIWIMADQNHLLYSTRCDFPWPKDKIEFVEDKTNPPNRAYLKLWELFSFYLFPPEKSQKAIDVGSSPGGWTWVLSELGCQVYSVDKAELRPDLMRQKNIRFQAKDVFKLNPLEWGKMDWFFSDLICTPEKLLELVQEWNRQSAADNFVGTLKFKGDVSFEAIRKWTEKFQSSKKNTLQGKLWGFQHLRHNKNEVTWYCVDEKYVRFKK